MKTTIQQAAAQFKPVSITITFETQAELDTFGATLNHHAVASTIEEAAGLMPYALVGTLIDWLREAGADIHQARKIDNLLKKHLVNTNIGG